MQLAQRIHNSGVSVGAVAGPGNSGIVGYVAEPKLTPRISHVEFHPGQDAQPDGGRRGFSNVCYASSRIFRKAGKSPAYDSFSECIGHCFSEVSDPIQTLQELYLHLKIFFFCVAYFVVELVGYGVDDEVSRAVGLVEGRGEFARIGHDDVDVLPAFALTVIGHAQEVGNTQIE